MSTIIEFSEEGDFPIIVEPFTGTERAKVAIVTTVIPVSRLWFRIWQNVGESPSGDSFRVRFMSGTVYHTLPPEGGEHLYTEQEPSTEIYFVLGYSTTVGAYDDNHPFVEIFELCE